MASQSLISTVNGYENYIEKNGIDEQVIDAYIQAVAVALRAEHDVDYGLKISARAKTTYSKLRKAAYRRQSCRLRSVCRRT